MGTVTGLKLSPSSRSYWGLIVNGITYNFEDLGFLIKSYQGAGLPTLSNNTIPYGTRGWESYQGTNVSPRLYILVGVIEGDSLKDITQKRQALISLLAPISGIAPSVKLKFQLIDNYGSTVGQALQVPVHYAGGLEGSIDNIWDESIALTFVEHAPSQITESTVNTTNLQTAGPLIPGLGSSVNTVWTRINGAWTQPWTGLSSAHAVMYDSTGDLWAGSGAGVYRRSNGASVYRTTGLTQINIIRQGPAGNIYVAGNGTPERMINTPAWQTFGSGTINQVYDMTVIPGPGGISTVTEIAYVVGTFTAITGTAGAINRIASLQFVGNGTSAGASWNTIGTGFDGPAYTIVYHPNGKLYIGGVFTTLNGTSAANIVEYDPTSGAIAALGTGVNGEVHDINILPDGRLLVSGTFTTAGGKTAYRKAYWDGYAWSSVPGTNTGHGSDNGFLLLSIVDPITGNYLSSTASTGADALFNGIDWSWGDIAWTGMVYDWTYRQSDGEFAVVFGSDTGAGGYRLSTNQAITNSSTHEVWPQIKIYGAPKLRSIINYTTGKILSFPGSSRYMGSGTVATLQCGGPAGVSLTSNIYGDITNAFASGSDIADFNLIPGTNYLGVLYELTPDASNYVQFNYQNQHWSLDASTIGA